MFQADLVHIGGGAVAWGWTFDFFKILFFYLCPRPLECRLICDETISPLRWPHVFAVRAPLKLGAALLPPPRGSITWGVRSK